MAIPKLCFLDMDGVIVDLHRIIHEKFGITDSKDKIDWNNGNLGLPNDVVWAGTDNQWWADLPWLPDGRLLLSICQSFFGKDNIVICTKAAKSVGCIEGKVMWLQKNLPHYAHKFIITPGKWWTASKNSVLIDDSDENVTKFREYGGEAVLIPREWNSAGIQNTEFALMKGLERILGPWESMGV